MDSISLSDIRNLSVAERIQLAQDIWDTVAEDAGALPLTDEQRRELEYRLADAEANPGIGRSWADVKKRLLPEE